MASPKNKAMLNRPMFDQIDFDSRVLTVLMTLYHRFTETGHYDVFIKQKGKLVRRMPVLITSDEGISQINIDCSAFDAKEECRNWQEAYQGPLKLSQGSMVGFYVSHGIGGFTILIKQTDHESKSSHTVLDNNNEIPNGDLLALTVIQPGTYQVVNDISKAESHIRVSMPDKGFQADQPSLLTIDDKGKFDHDSIELLAGQSVVFHCMTDCRLRILLDSPENETNPPVRKDPARFHRHNP